jgi:hypothetical protein
MAAGAPVDVTAEELARGDASQAEAFSAEVCLVGVSHVYRQSRHAVRTTPARRHRAGLSQREKSLKSQRPLEDLGTHPNRLQATAAQLARGERQVGGQGVDVDRVPGHQRLHCFANQRIRTSKLPQEVGLQDHERPLGRAGHRLHEAVRRTSPQLRQAQTLVHQVVEHRRKGWRGPWLEPHTHDGGVCRNDLDLRTGQRTKELGLATDRKVDLDSARGQVPLHVRRLTGALDPDCPHHPRQSRNRRPLNVRRHAIILAPKRRNSRGTPGRDRPDDRRQSIHHGAQHVRPSARRVGSTVERLVRSRRLPTAHLLDSFPGDQGNPGVMNPDRAAGRFTSRHERVKVRQVMCGCRDHGGVPG